MSYKIVGMMFNLHGIIQPIYVSTSRGKLIFLTTSDLWNFLILTGAKNVEVQYTMLTGYFMDKEISTAIEEFNAESLPVAIIDES